MPQANTPDKYLRTAPSCIRTKRCLELVETFLYPTVIQIFRRNSCET